MSPFSILFIFLSIMRVAILVAIAVLAVALLLHTIEELGRPTVLYQKRPPIAGWSRRFYPACLVLIAVLVFLAWFVTEWGTKHAVPFVYST